MNISKRLYEMGVDYIKIKESVLAFNDYMNLFGDKALLDFYPGRISVTFSSGPIYAKEGDLKALAQSMSKKWSCLLHKSDYVYLFFHDSFKTVDDAINGFFVTEYKLFRRRLKERGLKANEDVTNELLDFDKFPSYSDFSFSSFNDLNFKLVSTPEKDLIEEKESIDDLLEMQYELDKGLIEETDLTPQKHNLLKMLYNQQIHILNIEQSVRLVYSFMLLSITAEKMRKTGWKVY